MDEFDFGGGKFGQVAGALLARKDKRNVQGFQDALKASFALNLFGNLKRNQNQAYLKEEEDLKEEFDRLTKGNREVWDLAETDRNALRQYEKGGAEREQYLRNYAIGKFNTSNYAIESQLFVDDKGMAPKRGLGPEVLAILKQYETAEKERMENLKINPTYSAKTFDEFNEPLINEFQVKMDALENDPTKKSLFKKGLNKLFGYGAAEMAELDKAVKQAVAERKERQRFIKFSEDYIKNKVTTGNIDLNNSLEINKDKIAKILDAPNYKVNIPANNAFANRVADHLTNGDYVDLELDIYKGNKLEAEDKSNILHPEYVKLGGNMKLINASREVLEDDNRSPAVVIANDVAKIVGYFKFLQNEANEEGVLEFNQMLTDNQLEVEALRFLANDGRFQDMTDWSYLGTNQSGKGHGYIPLSSDLDYREVAEEFVDKFNLNGKTSEFINLAYNRKAQVQTLAAEDVFRGVLLEEQKDIFEERARLYKDPDKNQDLIDELEKREREISEVLEVGNNQGYTREFTRMLLSGDDSLPAMQLGNQIITLSDLSTKSKILIYEKYLDSFNLERDEELESLIGGDINQLKKQLNIAPLPVYINPNRNQFL